MPTMVDSENILLNINSPEEVNDFISEYTLEGKWNNVIMMYYEFPEAHTAIISDSAGTALHVAIDLDEEIVVKELVNAILTHNNLEALEMKNERGDTPLHFAASRGFARICKCIIGNNKERIYLLRRKNKDGETPLFQAAINGRKQAFAYLAHISEQIATLRDLLVRGDGDSILHTAIRGEYFDLAVIIVHRYDFLSTHRNKEGSTPLKVLATRPSAFKSSSNLPWYKRILYHCILVEPLDHEKALSSNLRKMEAGPDSKKMELPDNYTTLYNLFSLFGKMVKIHLHLKKSTQGQEDPSNDTKNLLKKNEQDPEDPSNDPSQSKLKKNKQDPKYHVGFLPKNYKTFLEFVKSAYVHTLGLSGVELKDVKTAKKKHIWSSQILKALMERPYAAFTGEGGQPTDREIDRDIYNIFDPNFNQGETSTFDKQVQKPKESEIKEATSTPNKTMMETKPEDEKEEVDKKETPFLVAAKNGIVEMVNEILDKIPSAIHNTNSKKENVLLVALKYGQPLIVETMMEAKPEDEKEEVDKKMTPFLVAAKNGIVELVNEILDKIPSAIHDTNSKKENVLLVAVKSRQPLIVETLRMRMNKDSKKELWNNLILAMDKEENTILHLAAEALGEGKPWQIAGSALQMMWDIKWFQYIKRLVPQHFYFRSNKKGETSSGIFKKKHESLIQESSNWLKDTSESCSVVSGLVAGVSFATASQVPGGTTDDGSPILEGKPAFDAFAISSLIGLCFSVTGLIMFLSILTSRKQAKDFRRDLPLKLLLGLSSLFVSIASLFVSFCSGHFFLLSHNFKSILFPIYATTCLPVTFYAVAQFPLYFDLLTAILTKVPTATDKGDNL